MLGPMHRKHAMNLERGSARRGECALGAIGAEDDLRIAPALNHVLVHFVVPRAVAGFSAGRVEHYFSAGLAGCGIEMNVAMLQAERSFHRVQVAGQSNIGPASGRFELQHEFMGNRRHRRLCRQRSGDDEQTDLTENYRTKVLVINIDADTKRIQKK